MVNVREIDIEDIAHFWVKGDEDGFVVSERDSIEMCRVFGEDAVAIGWDDGSTTSAFMVSSIVHFTLRSES